MPVCTGSPYQFGCTTGGETAKRPSLVCVSSLCQTQLRQSHHPLPGAECGSCRGLNVATTTQKKKYFFLLTSPPQVIGLFPSLSPDLRMTFTPPIKLPRIEGQDLEKALGALIKFLTDRRSMIAKLSKQDDESYEAEHNPQFASSMAGDLDEFGGGSTVGKRPSTVIKQLDDAPPMSTSLREMAQVTIFFFSLSCHLHYHQQQQFLFRSSTRHC